MPWFDFLDYYTVLSTCQGRHAQSGGVDFGTTHEVAKPVRHVLQLYLGNTLRHGAGNCIISSVNQQATILLKECVCGNGLVVIEVQYNNQKHEGGRLSLDNGQEGLFEEIAVW